MKRSTGNDGSFTLLELLVVIGIISALLVVTLPVVTSLTKSGGRKAAIGNLLGAIEQARQQAIKDGQATYVVFPDHLPASASRSAIQQYSYRSFAIFEDDPANPGSEKQLTPWRSLPTGVSIRNGSIDFLANTISFPFAPLGSGVTATFPFLKFTCVGEIDSSTTRNPNNTTGTINFGVFEGYIDANGNQVDTNKAKFTDTVAVSRLTGRAERL